MGKVVAVANMKGGVGKTTTVIMLAEGLAASGQTVVVVDADPQGNLGLTMLGQAGLVSASKGKRTLEAFIAQRLVHDRHTAIFTSVKQFASRVPSPSPSKSMLLPVHLVPSTPLLRTVERDVLVHLTKRGMDYVAIENRVRDLFANEAVLNLKAAYDWVIFDCAPGMNLATMAGLSICDTAILTVVPEPLPVMGLQSFIPQFVKGDAGPTGFPIKIKPQILLTRYLAKQVSHGEEIDKIVQFTGKSGAMCTMMETKVPELAHFAGETFNNPKGSTFAQKYPAGIVRDTLDSLVREMRDDNRKAAG